jgi:hypothetical protein
MSATQIDSERQLLRALCSDTLDAPTRTDCLARLAAYRFRDPSHQVLFDVLAELPRISAARLRELLPARANKRGFPDLDFASLFVPSTLSAEETLRLVDSLLKDSV